MFIKKSPYLKPNIEKLQRQSENIDGTYSSEYSKEIMKAILTNQLINKLLKWLKKKFFVKSHWFKTL